jgi:hypothetical protein
VVLDQLFTAWGRIWLPAFLGRIVVADRYVYDTAIEVEQSLPADDQIGRFLVGLMLRLAPKPHRAFLLDVEAGLARGRKPDEPWHRDLEAERQLYRDAAARHGLALVPAGGPFGGSVDPMIREVFMAYMGRFETVRNALLFSNPSQKNPPDPFWTGGGES